MKTSACLGLIFLYIMSVCVMAATPALQPAEIIMDLKYDEGPLTGNEPWYDFWGEFNIN